MKIIKSFFYILQLFASTLLADEFSSNALAYHAEKLNEHPTYLYPYPELAHTLAAQGNTTLPLFIYGSLLDERSAGRTLSTHALATRRPALAFGLKRVFNRDIPIEPESVFGFPCNDSARGMLNVEKTDHLENFMNGVIIDIPLNEIAALMEREIGYNLVPIIVTDWEPLHQGEMKYSIVHTLQAPAESIYVNPHILPRPGYYELTRDAAKQYGPFYEMLWYNTTFMADGITPVITWEHRLEGADAQICEKER